MNHAEFLTIRLKNLTSASDELLTELVAPDQHTRGTELEYIGKFEPEEDSDGDGFQ